MEFRGSPSAKVIPDRRVNVIILPLGDIVYDDANQGIAPVELVPLYHTSGSYTFCMMFIS